MKRFLTIAIAFQLFNFSTSQLLFAQKCVNPHFDAQRLDFRDLGYPVPSRPFSPIPTGASTAPPQARPPISSHGTLR